MAITQSTAGPVNSNEFMMAEQDTHRIRQEYAMKMKPMRENKNQSRNIISFLPFLLSLTFPLLQATLIVIAIFTPYFETQFNISGLEVLFGTFIGFITAGLIADLVGATIAAISALHKKYWECLIPLVLNLLFLPPKALLLLCYIDAIQCGA